MSRAAVAQAEGNSAVGLNGRWLLFYFTTAQTEHIGSSDGWMAGSLEET